MAYQAEARFHHSLLHTFRKRFSHDSLGKINETITRLITDRAIVKCSVWRVAHAATATFVKIVGVLPILQSLSF